MPRPAPAHWRPLLERVNGEILRFRTGIGNLEAEERPANGRSRKDNSRAIAAFVLRHDRRINGYLMQAAPIAGEDAFPVWEAVARHYACFFMDYEHHLGPRRLGLSGKSVVPERPGLVLKEPPANKFYSFTHLALMAAPRRLPAEQARQIRNLLQSHGIFVSQGRPRPKIPPAAR